MTKSLYKIAKSAKFQKLTLFVFNPISDSMLATKMYNILFESSWQIILTSSLSFDSRSNHFCVLKKMSFYFFYPHFIVPPALYAQPALIHLYLYRERLLQTFASYLGKSADLTNNFAALGSALICLHLCIMASQTSIMFSK